MCYTRHGAPFFLVFSSVSAYLSYRRIFYSRAGTVSCPWCRSVFNMFINGDDFKQLFTLSL